MGALGEGLASERVKQPAWVGRVSVGLIGWVATSGAAVHERFGVPEVLWGQAGQHLGAKLLHRAVVTGGVRLGPGVPRPLKRLTCGEL